MTYDKGVDFDHWFEKHGKLVTVYKITREVLTYTLAAERWGDHPEFPSVTDGVKKPWISKRPVKF